MLTSLKKKDVDLKYVDTGSNILGDILLWVLPLRADHRLVRVDQPAPRRARWARS